ncbi:major capsid protein [uncultured Acidaminococcus sp.]|uniref:major capsid protein n=1 Tax=uncultured Acidaminococcus sp. TaxID=352152 RepID=UPI0026DB3F50|nr:major capsid protein [uncultured Acidaminococcus sp.]
MAINYDDTRVLLGAMERKFKPNLTLVNTFFNNTKISTQEYVEMEYRDGARTLAPFVAPGGSGVNIARTGSTIRAYKAPLMKPKRIITPYDVMVRGFGEDIYSTKTPEERAMEMRARDLEELEDAVNRTQEWMAGQLLVNGSYDIKGYADDGEVTLVDTIDFPGWADKYKKVLAGTDTWDNAASTPYEVMSEASKTIRRASGEIPTVAICSSNVADLIVNNTQLRELMMVPSRDNLALMSIKPQIVNPEVIRVGRIESLNLDIYAYDGGYINEAGEFTTYLPDGYFIIGLPGKGHRLFGAVTQVEADGKFHTYAAAAVPKVTVNMDKDNTTLALSSRCVITPDNLGDWMTIKVK